MHYLVPYSKISVVLGDDGSDLRRDVVVNYDTLVDIIRHICAAIPVDKEWYCRTYKEVGAAIAAGAFCGSALYHYAALGYFEGRSPFGSSVTPLPPAFKCLMSLVDVTPARGMLIARSSTDRLRALLKMILSAIPVDRAWYLTAYPDAEEGIIAGTVVSAAEHFVHIGYFKNYWPYNMGFDEKWYLDKYPDLKMALDKKLISSAYEHFRAMGYRESRLPYANIPLM